MLQKLQFTYKTIIFDKTALIKSMYKDTKHRSDGTVAKFYGDWITVIPKTTQIFNNKYPVLVKDHFWENYHKEYQ